VMKRNSTAKPMGCKIYEIALVWKRESEQTSILTNEPKSVQRQRLDAQFPCTIDTHAVSS
jgi:hypothetical protein